MDSTVSNTATLMSSSTSVAKPSMDFRKSTGLGCSYIFSTFVLGRIMARGLLRESGAQYLTSAKRFEYVVYGVLLFFLACLTLI
jgi:hypothetical protein